MNTGMILMDLQKAFDRLDHKFFLEKMTCLGFKTPVIKWFESYLSSRKFFVSVDCVFSDSRILNCGAPQGFILGLLLFLKYINDLAQSLWESGAHLYIFKLMKMFLITQQTFVGLQNVFNTTIFRLPRRLEDILKTSWKRLGRWKIVTLKTS